MKSRAEIHPWNEELWAQLRQPQERQNHALLFNGHPGLGKRALAFAFAEHLIGQGGPQNAQLLGAGSHPDFHVLMSELRVQELEPDSPSRIYAERYLESHGGKPRRNLTIDQVRQLAESLTTHPHISSTRVVLFADADSLNRNAANALLKNLEEPPANTVFILVTDELAKLPKTIRSRCSLIDFRAPHAQVGRAWLKDKTDIPAHEIDSHLAMAGNQPLLAKEFYENGYVDSLKSVFTDINALWSRRAGALEIAQKWQKLGAMQSLAIIHKLCADLLRCQFNTEPADLFFPVQEAWIRSSAAKLARNQLLQTLDEIAATKRLLTTTVDELLALEQVAVELQNLPKSVSTA